MSKMYLTVIDLGDKFLGIMLYFCTGFFLLSNRFEKLYICILEDLYYA